MSEKHQQEALEQARWIHGIMWPCEAKDALDLAIKSGQLDTVRDALIGAKKSLSNLGPMIDHWIAVCDSELSEFA